MNIVDVLNIAQQPARDRTARYCERLDAELAKLKDDAQRCALCQRELEKWLDRYRLWADAVDSGRLDATEGGATAWDYTLTIAAIDKRRAKYRATEAAHA